MHILQVTVVMNYRNFNKIALKWNISLNLVSSEIYKLGISNEVSEFFTPPFSVCDADYNAVELKFCSKSKELTMYVRNF